MAKTDSNPSPLRKLSLKAAIFCCFDVFPVLPSQKLLTFTAIHATFPFLMNIAKLKTGKKQNKLKHIDKKQN